jgi:hypothetical protein
LPDAWEIHNRRWDPTRRLGFFHHARFLTGQNKPVTFAGPISRSHGEMVINVGNGGKISPTLVIRDETREGSA